VRRVLTVGALVVLGLLAGGCGHSRGISRSTPVALRAQPKPMSAAEAVRSMRRTQAWWRHQIRSRAAAYPHQRFNNPTAAELHHGLTTLASRYHFVVKSLDLWQPLPHQYAPTVVVQANDPHAFASATGAIMRWLDPKKPTNDDRTGWRYEGFFMKAIDGKDVPFVGVYNFMRGVYSRGGGQWARSEDLFPFAHGGLPVRG
jgi:hypothetical protein